MNKTKQRQKLHKKDIAWKVAAVVAALFVWQLLAMVLHNKILLSSPLDVMKVWIFMLFTGSFYSIIGFSIGRIILGVVAGILLGLVCAGLAGRSRFVEAMLWPYVTIMKATPIASIIIILLIWMSSRNISIFVSFLMVFPIMYINVLEGIKNLDARMEEVADVFEITGLCKLLTIILPQLSTYIVAALKTCIGLAWKAGVAAEVIGSPVGSIGHELYNAKVYLETPQLFAWTITIILLGVLSETLVVALAEWIFESANHFYWKLTNADRIRSFEEEKQTQDWCIRARDISYKYDEKPVLEHLDFELHQGEILQVLGESGIGKTTLISILSKRLKPQTGSVEGLEDKKISMLWQEDRLVENMTVAANIRMSNKAAWNNAQYRMEIENHLKQVGLEHVMEDRVSSLSGGMKRRVAIVRAVLAPSDLLLLDEPFAGLDEANTNRVISYITKYQNGRGIVLVTHGEREQFLQNAKVVLY